MVGSQGAGSGRPATPRGSCDGSPPGTTERTGGRRQAPLGKEEWRKRETRREKKEKMEKNKDNEEETEKEGGEERVNKTRKRTTTKNY